MSRHQLASILVIGAMLSGLDARAADPELWPLFVRKGYLTQEEASSISQQRGVTSFSAAGEATISLRFNSLVHMQYNGLSTKKQSADGSDGIYSYDPPAQNNFQLRRLYLGVTAELFDDWRATVNGDFASGSRGSRSSSTGETATPYATSGGGASGEFRLEKGIITWHGLEKFVVHFGYMKVPLGYEETTATSKLKTIERSASNNFFINQLGYGARHTGVYLKGGPGEMADRLGDGYYGFGITDPRQGHVDGYGIGRSNTLAFWGRLGVMSSFAAISFNLGVNGGYIHNSRADDAIWAPVRTSFGATLPATKDYVYGIYANIDWAGFSLMGEFMGARLQNATATSAHANPFGFTVMPAYRFAEAGFGDFELVGQYSYVDSDGHGILPGAVIPGASSTASGTTIIDPSTGASAALPQLFQRMHAFYFGGTWFILGDDVTLSAGFNYARFKNNLTATQVDAAGGASYVVGGRARLQLLF